MVTSVVVAVCALSVGVLLGRFTAKRSATGAGFAALGATAGLMIGMSSSPIVAASVGVILGLLTLLVPLYFQDQANRLAAADPSQVGHLKTLPTLDSWLFPFAFMLLSGVLIGGAIRVNDWLNAKPQHNLVEIYRQMGFNEDQIKAVMAGHAKVLASSPAPQPVYKPQPDNSSFHNLARAVNWATVWKSMVDPKKTPEENLKRIKAVASPDILVVISQLEEDQESASAILEKLKPE